MRLEATRLGLIDSFWDTLWLGILLCLPFGKGAGIVGMCCRASRFRGSFVRVWAGRAGWLFHGLGLIWVG